MSGCLSVCMCVCMCVCLGVCVCGYCGAKSSSTCTYYIQVHRSTCTLVKYSAGILVLIYLTNLYSSIFKSTWPHALCSPTCIHVYIIHCIG